MSEPKPITPADLVTAPPRIRSVDDISPEERAALEDEARRRAALVEHGERIRAKLGTLSAEQMRAETLASQEAIWRGGVVARANARGVPSDPDVRRFALRPDPGPGEALDQVRTWLAWRAWIAGEQGARRAPAVLVLLSEPGTGKSSALGHAVAWHRDNAAYVTASDLASSPRTAHTETHGPWERRVNCDLLAVDEIGTEPESADGRAESGVARVLRVVLERWTRARATILAGNLTAEAFLKRYAEPRLESRLRQQAARGGTTMAVLTCGDLRVTG